MRLTTLSDPILLVEQHLKDSRRILRESCDGLTLEQRRIVEGIYNEFVPLIEASLTADQVKQIFGAVEKQAIAGGGSRTMVGKGVDVAKQVDAVVNNVGKWLQNTAPVKFADEKFEQLKAKVGAKFPELDKQLTDMGTWMKENPGKTAAIIGVMTALAGLAGGPVGGAIAGQVIRNASELIKGEKLSTAVGKGIKTAAYGAIAGWLLDGLGDWLEGLRAKVVPFDKVPGLVKLEVGISKTLRAPGMMVKDTVHNVFVPEDLAGTMMATIREARAGDISAFNELLGYSRDFSIRDYLAGKAISDAASQALAQQNDLFLQTLKGADEVIRAAAQGAIAGKLDANSVSVDGKPLEGDKAAPKQESYYVQKRPLSEGQVYMLFNRVERLDEGPMDLLKKAGSAVAKGASWVGKQTTEKITSAKLLASWKLEGSPTDSEELAKFLKGQGVSDDIVKSVYTDMKLPVAGAAEEPAAAAGADIETIKKMLAKVRARDRAVLAKTLQKEIGASA